MPQYKFRAVNPQGQILRGRMEATDENALAQQLAALGYEPLRATLPRAVNWKWPSAAPNDKELALLFTQLAALAGAGVPLAQCLEDTAATLPDSPLRDGLRAVLQQLRQGGDFIAACAAQPRLFPHGVITVLQAGMASGDLALAFAKARDHAQWRAEFAATLRRALRYPLFLLALALGVVAFMMLFVVPQLAEFLLAQDYALPWHTHALIACAAAFPALVWLLPPLLLAPLLMPRLLRRTPELALARDRLLLRLPVIGMLLRHKEMAHYLHHLALLLGGGVAILPALESARAALGNRALRAQADDVIAQIAAGRDLASTWAGTGDFGGLLARRAQIGLQSGTLAAQLQEASAACDREAMLRSKELAGALEPTLTLTVGLLLIWIVLSVIGPLYGALGALSLAR